jgi:hypothetical protein
MTNTQTHPNHSGAIMTGVLVLILVHTSLGGPV